MRDKKFTITKDEYFDPEYWKPFFVNSKRTIRKKPNESVVLPINHWRLLYRLLKNFEDLHFIRKEIKKQVLR